jgi:hypothetical protein
VELGALLRELGRRLFQPAWEDGVLGFPDPLTVHGAVVELPLRLEL